VSPALGIIAVLLATAAEPPERADRTFTLDIGERRITEAGFQASTAVQLPSEARSGYLLRVGAAVIARRIDVVLRNVHGQVRFRADTSALRQRLTTMEKVNP
jgi:hypothetical protein